MTARIEAPPIAPPLPGGREGATLVVHPLKCAEIRGPAGWFEVERGPLGALRALGLGVPREQLVRVPVIAFLVEHPGAGPVLVDTGFRRAVVDGSAAERNRLLGPIGRLIGGNVQMSPEQTIAAQLRGLGVEPQELGLIVMTHLHFDHAGALADFPSATVLASNREWAAAHGRAASLFGYPPAQFDPRPAYRTLDFEAPPARAHGPFARALDLFGDGSIVLLDTPGHSAGHLSVLVRLRERELLIAGDAIYTLATLREGRRPWRSADRRAFERSVRALQDYDRANPEAVIVPGHDIAHWETLADRYE
jgi:glyoxylase-like metal-dependent hydrolase (beta-lactamase superfamily II)